MTTNGFMLPVYAEKLKEAGMDRINISFHSLERIRRSGCFEELIVLSKDIYLTTGNARILKDTTEGTLIDSILFALEQESLFMAFCRRYAACISPIHKDNVQHLQWKTHYATMEKRKA